MSVLLPLHHPITVAAREGGVIAGRARPIWLATTTGTLSGPAMEGTAQQTPMALAAPYAIRGRRTQASFCSSSTETARRAYESVGDHSSQPVKSHEPQKPFGGRSARTRQYDLPPSSPAGSPLRSRCADVLVASVGTVTCNVTFDDDRCRRVVAILSALRVHSPGTARATEEAAYGARSPLRQSGLTVQLALARARLDRWCIFQPRRRDTRVSLRVRCV